MEFCPQCRGRMTVEMKQQHVNVCLKCGTKLILEIDNAIRCLSQPVSEQVVIIEGEDELQTLPTTNVVCPKCGSRRAYFQITEVGYEEDMMNVSILRCTHCMYTWREKG